MLKIILFTIFIAIQLSQRLDVQINPQQFYSFAQMKTKVKDDEGGGGSKPQGISEKKARKIIQDEFVKLDESMNLQNEKVLEVLANGTDEQQKMLNESVKNLTLVVDKMVYHMDKRISRLNEQLEENIYQTEEMSFIILEDQLQKKKIELAELEARISQLEEQLPELEGECDAYFSCSECMSNKKCGWCSMEQRCVLGDEDGPLFINCNFYNYQYCAGRECSKYTSCQQCLSDPQCGWCKDDERQLSGCIEQQADYQGCPRKGWFHIESHSNICPKHLEPYQIEEEDIPSEDDWARRDQEKKQKKKSKKQLEEEKEQYEKEIQRVKAERQKQIDSITPMEKKQKLKEVQDELKDKRLRRKALKKQIKKLEARYLEMLSRMREMTTEPSSDAGGEEEEQDQEEEEE